MYKKDALNQSNVNRWLKHLRMIISQENDTNVMTPFKSLDDKPRCGHPSSVVHLKSTEVEEIILENQGITVKELASELDASVGSAFIIIKSLQYRKVCS